MPVYYGDSKIGKVFDENGIIRIEEGSLDVNEMLSSLSKELYEKMLPAIRHNLKVALNYQYFAEDVMDMIVENLSNEQ